jgi:predicted MFS family arabinose efflux permease
LRLSIFLLSLAAFASAASMRVTDALLPRLSLEFGVGIAKASAVITGFSVAYGAMQVLFGPLGDRFGKLRVIAIASGAAGLATVVCFFVSGFEGLVASRVLAGAFCAAIIPLSMAWIGDVVAYEDRQPVLARFLLGQILGMTAGAAFGGFAADQASWRWPFALIAGWLCVSCVLLLMASRHDPAPCSASESRFFTDLANVLRVPWARVIVITVFIEGLLTFGALAFVPTHLHFVRAVDLSTAGLIVVAYGLGGALFAVFARPVVRKLGEVGLAVFGTLLLSAGFVLIAFAGLLWLMVAGCLVSGLGFYMLHNTLQTNATQMAPQRRGAAMALFASMLFLGQSCGVALAGWMLEAVGTTGVMLGAALALVPLGMTFARLRRSRTVIS